MSKLKHVLEKYMSLNCSLCCQESKKVGKQSFMYAWVLDETEEERSRKRIHEEKKLYSEKMKV